MLTRWDEWFSTDNRARDPRIEAAPPSHSAARAVQAFRGRRVQRILDLACGIGRDTFTLAAAGLSMTGADASFNGLQAAQQSAAQQQGAARWLQADARCLPFQDDAWEGVYCFGLLHEFTSPYREEDIARVMGEIRRVLCTGGLLALAVLAGDPQAGLPAVQMFSRPMLDEAVQGFTPVEIEQFDDIGCTGRPDYRVWFGVFVK